MLETENGCHGLCLTPMATHKLVSRGVQLIEMLLKMVIRTLVAKKSSDKERYSFRCSIGGTQEVALVNTQINIYTN